MAVSINVEILPGYIGHIVVFLKIKSLVRIRASSEEHREKQKNVVKSISLVDLKQSKVILFCVCVCVGGD